MQYHDTSECNYSRAGNSRSVDEYGIVDAIENCCVERYMFRKYEALLDIHVALHRRCAYAYAETII